ncbi:hypothetical protein O1W71_02230 [Microbacterium sp. H37-C3]|uniref:hypothetical protein n=1 Tax=Microbacterium sp. H37-C3 TaxID=3004354 RepID=UPI0022AE64E1|nr:hypothetical protein [Microbacterium sp. H37-C3]MCZ4066486.1 hypothetical protein [Microbacterium sp. H37-C3]
MMDNGETIGLVTCPCGWSKRGYFRDLHDHQDDHRRHRDQEERLAIIRAAVRAIEPNVQNETAAWNTWNNLASSDEFRRAIVMIDRERRWNEHESTGEERR